MGNRASGCLDALSARGRKMRMLNSNLERFNTRIAELNETLSQLNIQENALVFRIRKEINALRLRHGKQVAAHAGPGTQLYKMVAELADVKQRNARTHVYLGKNMRDRQAINTLILNEDQESRVELTADLKRFGLTLETVQQSGEEEHLASADLSDLAAAAEPTAVSDTQDIGALLASLLNEAPAAVPVYAANGTQDVVNAVADLASGRAPLHDDQDNNDDDDATASVVLNDDPRGTRASAVLELAD